MRVVATLRGHTGLVTVRYEHGGDGTEAYSCGVDGMVRVWRREKGAEVFEWVSSQVMDGLTSACVGISSVSTKKGVLLSASDSGGKVMIWSRLHTSSQFELEHIVTMPPTQTPHVLHLARLDDDDAVCLLIGAVDSKIHVQAASNPYESSTFKGCGVLSGHEEWVTSLSSRRLNSKNTNKGGFLLASGSKDCKSRVWRFEPEEAKGGGSIEGTGRQLDAVGEEDIDIEDDGDNIAEEADAAKIAMIDTEEESKATEARLEFRVPSSSLAFRVYLETLLVGHEDWVTSVQWLQLDGGLLLGGPLPRLGKAGAAFCSRPAWIGT